MVLERTEFERDLKHMLQETNLYRSLDSLETIIIRSYLSSKGIEVSEDELPKTHTIGGWLEWADRFLHDG